MHGLFVREVLKRQRDSIPGLNAEAIPRVSTDGAAKNAARSGKAPSPDIQIKNK
jgi:hypothetical protein